MNPALMKIVTAFCAVGIGAVLFASDGKVDLFDAAGKPAAMLDSEGHLIDYEGRVVGYLRVTAGGPAAVYANTGTQIGWFKSGAFHDLEGRAVWAVSRRHLSATEIPPVHPAAVVGPAVLGVPDAPKVPPVFTNDFAPAGQPITEPPPPQLGSNLVLPRFNPATPDSSTVNDGLRMLQRYTALAERQQAIRQRAADFEQQRANREAWAAAADAEIERKRNEIQRQEMALRDSAEQLRRAKDAAAVLNAALAKQTAAISTIRASPYGPGVAVKPIPELGMMEGDAIWFGSIDNGAVDCTLQDFSLERELFAPTVRVFGDSITKTKEPVELLAAVVEAGRLRKMSQSEFGGYVQRYLAEVEEARTYRRRLVAAYDCRVEGDLGSGFPPRGSTLRIREVGPQGVLFTRADESKHETTLPAIPMKTVMAWINSGSLALREPDLSKLLPSAGPTLGEPISPENLERRADSSQQLPTKSGPN